VVPTVVNDIRPDFVLTLLQPAHHLDFRRRIRRKHSCLCICKAKVASGMRRRIVNKQDYVSSSCGHFAVKFGKPFTKDKASHLGLFVEPVVEAELLGCMLFKGTRLLCVSPKNWLELVWPVTVGRKHDRDIQ